MKQAGGVRLTPHSASEKSALKSPSLFRLSSTNYTCFFLEYFVPYELVTFSKKSLKDCFLKGEIL